MPILKIGSNLNSVGNAGNFETDPSTWLIPTKPGSVQTRSNDFPSKNLYSRLLTINSLSGGSSPYAVGRGQFNAASTTSERFYEISVKVRTNSGSSAIGVNAAQVYLAVNNMTNVTIIDDIRFTVSELKSGYEQLILRIKYTGSIQQAMTAFVYVDEEDNVNVGGELYMDEFDIYEYVNETIPDCNISIDLANTVITAESIPGAEDAGVTIAVNGTPQSALQYSINGLDWPISPVFNNRLPGNYTIYARESGRTSCVATANITLPAAPPNFEITLTPTAETSPGANDGQISTAINGTGGPFNYSIDGINYKHFGTFTNLTPGNYTVYVKDNYGNTLTKTTTVAAATCDLAINVGGSSVVDETSVNGNNGSITVAKTGGTGTIEYSKNGGVTWQTSNLFSNLAPGNYNIVIREQATIACNDSAFFTVDEFDAGFDFTAAIVHEAFDGNNDGQITVNVTGAGAPFTYSLNGIDYESSNVFEDLSPGSKRVRVKDNGGTVLYKDYTVNVGAFPFDFTLAITNESTFGAADGQIVITVDNYASYGAPFTYSSIKGQFTPFNYRNNLAPGEYTITVKNNLEKQLSKSVTIDEGEFIFNDIYFSKNIIPFSRPQTANSGEENYKIYNKVTYKPVASGTFADAMDSALTPDADGNVTFNNRPALKGLMNPVAPSKSLNVGFIELTDRSIYIKNNYGDIFDDKVVPDSTTETLQDLVIFGGIDKNKYADTDFFNTYLPSSKKFMTWAPVEKTIDPVYQAETLQYLVLDARVTQLKKVIKAYYDDDTNQTGIIATSAIGTLYGKIFQINTGYFGGVLSINGAKTVTKYEVWLTDQDDNIITEVRTYKISKFTPPNVKYIMILNSLGAHELIRLTGKSYEQITTERSMVQKHLDFNYSALDGEYKTVNTRKKTMLRYSSGLYAGKTGKQWAEYLQEIVLSEQVYDVTNSGKYIPINIMPGTFKILADEDYNHFIRFEATTGYNDELFTPKTLP